MLQSNRKILQLQNSSFFFLVFKEKFHPSWIICKHFFFKGLLIFCCVNSFVECIRSLCFSINSYPSAIHLFCRKEKKNDSRPCTGHERTFTFLGDPSTLLTWMNFHSGGSVHFVDLIEFLPSRGSVHFVDFENFHPLWVIRPLLWTWKIFTLWGFRPLCGLDRIFTLWGAPST